MTHEHNGVVDGSGRIDLVKAPIVVMHGDKDIVVPLTDSQYTSEVLKDQGELVIFENVGHSVLTDNLDLLVNTLVQRI